MPGQFFPVEQDSAGDWCFRYETTEDPAGDLRRAGLMGEEGSDKGEWSQSVTFSGYAYLGYDSVHPKGDLLKCQEQLKRMGWTPANPTEQL
jgi:hypothetical protein